MWPLAINQKVQEVGQKHPEATVEVWAMDEHRLRLKSSTLTFGKIQ
ncbi:hypothetical protein [Okeania hirsuta]|nr:hypothetical protein [Okeania hirsuta]